MRKSTRIVKRVLALFLVVLMSIENFAAVVSDNDGSAFITKAEFDSLRNDFQSQIDQYNTSIDAKIDGAIASYLAGINLSKDTTYKVEVADWEEVTATNHVLPENWTMPSLNLTFNYQYCSTNNQGNWYEIWWGGASIVYSKPASTHQIRNLVSAGQESSTYTLPTEVVWVGQSQDYADKITGVKTGVCESIYSKSGTAPDPYTYRYLFGATTGDATTTGMSIINALQLQGGNVKSRTVNNTWCARIWWRNLSSAYCYPLEPTVESDWINRDITTSIALNYVDGKQYKYQHIINWGNYDYKNLSDSTWTNSLGTNPAFTEDDVVTNSSVSKKGNWGVLELNDSVRTDNPATWIAAPRTYTSSTPVTGTLKYQPTTRSFDGYYSGSYGATRTEKVKSVGVLDTTYKSEKILQWSGKRKLNRDENISYEKINLYNGALIAYAKQDETFKWEPKITGTYDNSGTDVAITRWRVKLSDKPFGTGESLGSGGKVLKNAGQTNDYLVTDDTGKCKFNFQLGDNTTIWCKWWPDDTNICNNYNWKGTLDLTQCGTYTITEAQ